MKKQKINFHPSKIWGIIYPMFAKEIVLGESYEEFADELGKVFDLTPEQWGAILENYEFIKSNIY